MTVKDDYLSKQSKHMVAQVLRFLASQEEKQDKTVVRELSMTFLASFIGSIVYAVLKEKPVKSKDMKDALDFTANNFLELKIGMQNAMAAGFQGAMQEYSGKSVEYYCQVKTVPEPVNKQPC